MSRKILREKVIYQAMTFMAERELKYLTPALIAAASMYVTSGRPEEDELEDGAEKDLYLEDFSRLKNTVFRVFSEAYLGEGASVRDYLKHSRKMQEALLIMAKIKDRADMNEQYKTAVVRMGPGGDHPGLELFNAMLTADKELSDPSAMEKYLKKAEKNMPKEKKNESKTEKTKKKAEPLIEENEELDIAAITRRGMEMRKALKEDLFGQDAAINEFVQGYMQYLMNGASKERKHPAVFLFAGPSGTGKSSLAKAVKDHLHYDFKQFDMTGFSDHQSPVILIGHTPAFKDAREGTLTGFVRQHPKSVVLLDEIEKAHLNVKNLFLQILEDGVLHDDFHDEDVDFSDTILIFTTNAGKSLYEASERKLSLLPKETVINALRKEKREFDELAIPPALLSRLSAGRLVMFDHIDVSSLLKIIENRLKRYAEEFELRQHISIEYDRDVAASILYSIGASADARRASAQTDHFITNQIMNMVRNMDASDSEASGKIRKIRFTCDPGNDPKIVSLFKADRDLKTLFFGFKKKHESLRVDDIDRAANVEDALKKLSEGDYELFLCDIHYWNLKQLDERVQPLSAVKEQTNGRILMERVLDEYPHIPVYVIEDGQKKFNNADRVALQQMGVRGTLDIDDRSFGAKIDQIREGLAKERHIYELGRSNSSLAFNTIEYVSADGSEVEIRLCEYEITTSIQAGDEESVLDKMSLPDDTFGDIIGQEHVKSEMEFFIRYLKDPRSFREHINSVPKGLLLYGPAGTGKTMLARAFAHEAGLAFLATQGNDFIGMNGADEIHRIFATARKYAPAAIFIDEVDALAKARTGYDTQRESALTALLVEMDGFKKDQNRPVFVIAATNYNIEGDQMSLDPAVVRRFDNQLFVDLPDKKDRLEVLKKEFAAHKDVFRLSDGEIDNIATRTVGRSFAWLRNMINMALRTMIMKGWDHIDDEKIEYALETFSDGQERKHSDEVILATARHEAGHALISRYFGNRPAYITITSRGNYGGYVQSVYDEDKVTFTREELLKRIAVSMGGRAAEIVCYGKDEGINSGASSDLAAATRVAEMMISAYGMDDEYGMAAFTPDLNDPIFRNKVSEMMKEQMDRDIGIISEYRDVFDELVAELVKKNHLSEEEIEKVLNKAFMKS